MIVKFNSFSSKYEDYSKFNIFLFHGSNEGKVVECKNYVLNFRKLREREKEVINIYSSEMKSEDFSNLTLRLKEQNIFGFITIVNIYLSSEKNNQELIKLIMNIEKAGDNNVHIILRSNQLPTRSKLRKLFESQGGMIVVPCYEEDDFEKIKIVKDFFMKEGITFSSEEIHAISKRLSYQRLEIKNELEKIAIIAKNNPELQNSKKLYANTLGSLEISSEKFISSIVTGEDKTFFTGYNKFTNFGQDNIKLINYLLEHLFRILISKIRIRDGMSIHAAISSLKPPVFFKNTDSFKIQIKKLRFIELKFIIKKLYECKKQILEGKISAQYFLLITLLKFYDQR